MTAVPVAIPGVRAVNVLWRFSRPHTIIGTALSVVGLYAIAAAQNTATDALDLAATLIAGLAVNIAIVGVNQLTDVEIDRVNKPYLPIAAGDLTPRNATIIVAACTVIPLAMALTQGAAETIAVAADQASDAFDLAATVIAGLAVNIAIVGVNQLTDVEIDRVNKPYLPIAAGDLTPRNATIIVAACTVIPLAMALTQGAAETIAVAAALAVGALYSLPPVRLKRFPLAASLCITGVRSIVVNLGVYYHFAHDIAPPVWALCLFVLPFSFAIAVLKDVPDIEGDRAYSIRTFTVRLGAEKVFAIGLSALALAYAGMIFLGPWLLAGYVQPVVLVVGHLAAAGVLLYLANSADPGDKQAFTRFYMRVWALFFLEYLLVPLACLMA